MRYVTGRFVAWAVCSALQCNLIQKYRALSFIMSVSLFHTHTLLAPSVHRSRFLSTAPAACCVQAARRCWWAAAAWRCGTWRARSAPPSSPATPCAPAVQGSSADPAYSCKVSSLGTAIHLELHVAFKHVAAKLGELPTWLFALSAMRHVWVHSTAMR